MQILRSLSSVTLAGVAPTCVMIGNFDGVHRGHCLLARRVREIAAERALIPTVITFDPHPKQVLAGQDIPPPLMDQASRLELLSEQGMQLALLLPFTTEMAEQSPEEFIRPLVEQLQLQALVVGYDFTLGKNRSGTVEVLRELGTRYGFTVEQCPPVLVDDIAVSSSRIRALLQDGHVEAAHLLLGRPHSVQGMVVHGQKRGSTLLGFPTANIEGFFTLLPKADVYASYAQLEGRTYRAVTNVGRNPTFGENALTVETHLLDFRKDIYGHMLRIDFMHQLRHEKSFASIAELKAQIQLDTEDARRLLQG